MKEYIIINGGGPFYSEQGLKEYFSELEPTDIKYINSFISDAFKNVQFISDS